LAEVFLVMEMNQFCAFYDLITLFEIALSTLRPLLMGF